MAESVHVLTGVVGHDDDEAVDVGKGLGEEEVLDGSAVHALDSKVLTNEQEGEGKKEEVDDSVGGSDDAEVLPQGVEGSSRGEESLDGDGPLGVETCGDLLALTTEAGELELLVGVGRVVEPLPGHHVEYDDHVLDEHGDVHVAQIDEVLLDEIGVVDLGEAVVVTVVVLDVPRLGHHPVEPVADTTPKGAYAELEAVPPALVGVDPVVSAMAGVVCDHGPACAGPCAEGKDGNNVHRETHGEKADCRAHVGPGDHFAEVVVVILALSPLKSVAQGLDLGSEAFNIKVLDPLILHLELLGSCWFRVFAHVSLLGK